MLVVRAQSIQLRPTILLMPPTPTSGDTAFPVPRT